jgi:hypothetical protein
MNNYRCQNVYILATASERKVDNLEFSPHNSTMPQLSSTDRLIMAANDTTNASKHPHPEVPFAHVGYDTITALTPLEEIFKNKFQKLKSPELLIPQVRPAHKYPISPCEMIHPLGEIMQYVCKLTRSTRLCATSHSQPLINAKYKFQVKYLKTKL